jgi:hypothetical protein
MKAPITFLQGIIIAIIAPIVLLVVFIIFSNHNALGMVEKDYYQKEQNYQSLIDREIRTNQLSQKVNIYNDDEGVVLHFPTMFSPADISGNVVFFRPSNPNNDFVVQVNLNEDGLQSISTIKLQKGAWILKIFWNNQQDEFYSEKRIFIDR